METWIENLDHKMLMNIMLNKYLLDKVKEALEVVDVGHSYKEDQTFQLWIELRKLPSKSDLRVKAIVRNIGLDKYMKVTFNVDRNYLYIVFNLDPNLTKEDMESISGILLLLGYGNEI